MSTFLVRAGVLLTGLLPSVALAAPAVPAREIPPEVLQELQLLENRFELALAADCDPAVCSSKGCVWVDHAVTDRPADASMPGLADEPGPSSTNATGYLTRAQCSFANEATLPPAQAQALVRRLQTRLTRGWTVVSVDHEVLPPLAALELAPVEEGEEAPAPVVAPVPIVEPDPGRELWTTLLPHLWWMIGVGLVTLAATTLVWAARRVGKASVEEQMLLAQLTQPEPPPTPVAPTEESAPDPFVTAQEASWKAMLEGMDPKHPAPELQAMVRDRLRAGDLPLLAKAALKFPEHFPALFPTDGEIATAKVELAELIRTADPATLPGDAELFTALQRHLLAAKVGSQPDARLVRSLREDFGTSGLVALIGKVPARVGALLFALAPPVEQHEVARLLPAAQVTSLARQLLRSTRMDTAEAQAVFAALGGDAGVTAARVPDSRPGEARGNETRLGEVSDRGAPFDAAGALAVLLPTLPPGERAAIWGEAIDRSYGSLPAWTRAVLTPDLLLALPTEARADLFLEVEAEALAAWMSLAEPDQRALLLTGVPDSLRAALQASGGGASRARQLALASRARRDLARGFQRHLGRLGVPFEAVLNPEPAA